MAPKEIGRRLKEARLARRMTQSEVVGTYITRNMLSQIESGAATPSLRTLQYLADVLGIPMNELMREEEPTAPPAPKPAYDTAQLLAAKQAFSQEDFAAVQAHAAPLLSEDSPFRDEAHYLLAHTHFITARRAADAGDVDRSIEHLLISLDHSAKSFYADADIRTDARVLLRAMEKQKGT